MNLKMTFDEEMMRRYDSRGSELLFNICWVHEKLAYPSEDWLDFGGVIMGWWLVAAVNLLKGEPTERFVFMDGPYAFDAKWLDINSLTITFCNSEHHWTVPANQFFQELIQGATIICKEFIRIGTGGETRLSIEKGLDELKHLLEQRNKLSMGEN